MRRRQAEKDERLRSFEGDGYASVGAVICETSPVLSHLSPGGYRDGGFGRAQHSSQFYTSSHMHLVNNCLERQNRGICAQKRGQTHKDTQRRKQTNTCRYFSVSSQRPGYLHVARFQLILGHHTYINQEFCIFFKVAVQ